MTRATTSAYAETLASLFSRAAGEFKLGLEAPRALLAALGDPQRSLPHVVLVAGTNGKGSTAALVAGALQTAGHRVGFFASPHLMQFNERIRVNQERITTDEVIATFAEIRAVEHHCPVRPSFFECTTAMAAMTFARRQVDVAVFEVGLGGRLDATNVIDRDLAVITPIALDHEKLLGHTIREIAREKADILPHSGDAVVAPQPPEALAVLEEVACARATRLEQAPRATWHDCELTLEGPRGSLAVPAARHPHYQWTNVATAVAACRALDRLGVACPEHAIARAVEGFSWPGRYQWLDNNLVMDGAHNPAAVTALLDALARDPRAQDRPLHCVFSALRDKAADAMVERLHPRVAAFYVCPLQSRRRRSPAELGELVPGAPVHPTVDASLAAARGAAAADGGLVLVTGSLMLVGEAFAAVTGAERDPPVDG